MLETHIHATVSPAPQGKKRFEVHHMRRIPVILTDSAKAFLDGSTRQGRVFPQALSEFFGTLPEIKQIDVDIAEDGRVMVHVKHCEDDDKHHQFYLDSKEVAQPSKPPGQGFHAARTADKLLRLYRLDVLQEGSV
jgi:hypothetical protein